MNSARADSAFPSTVDLIGLNYQGTGVRGNPPQYPVFRQRYPEAFIFGAETASAISSRGEYAFPVAKGFGSAYGPTAGQDVERRHMSSYDLYWAPWGATPDHEFFSQARWRPDLRMAHLLPHWTWPERVGLKDSTGAPLPTPVHVYTSGDEGELFLNGHAISRAACGSFVPSSTSIMRD
jgi:beta-galactosidase